MDDAGPPSLFVVLHYYRMDPPYFSILQLDTPDLQLDTALRVIKKTKVVENEYVRLNEEEPMDGAKRSWLFSSPTSSTEDLYMVPYGGGCKQQFRGFRFNFTTENFVPINPPEPSKMYGHVVNVRGRIYFIGYDWFHHDKRNVFQCYDPDENSWKSLEPFPYLARSGPIVTTAVWGDHTILFNVNSCDIWAYDVSENRWCLVDVEDRRCYETVGEAVVVNNTIYALASEPFNLVLALSIRKDRIDGDLVFKCSLHSEFFVRGMKPIDYQDMDASKPKTWLRTRHLVHLGKDNFCLVQCCQLVFGFSGYQNIQLSYTKLEGKNSRVVADFVHKTKLPSRENFHVQHCFSLPKCKTNVLKEGKIFNLDLYFKSNEEVDKLTRQVMSLKDEVDELTCALENKTKAEMKLKSAYDVLEQSKSSFSAREGELESKIQQSRLRIEQLKANLMDKETKLQGILVELASRREPYYGKDKLKAALLDKETELTRVKKELKLWRTSAKAASDMLLFSTGNNEKSRVNKLCCIRG